MCSIRLASTTRVQYWLNLGHHNKSFVTKAYVCVFVSFTVKAVHLEPISELTTAAFIATLRRFMARRGKPIVIWSDHGTNFVGAAKEIKELYALLKTDKMNSQVAEFCSTQGIQWRYTPEHALHFGSLWKAAVKSFKHHFRQIVGCVRLTFEELTTVLTHIEACLNSRPLAPLPHPEDGIGALTPGHFLVGATLEALPDTESPATSTSLLQCLRWCQALIRHFWQRWSTEYLTNLQKLSRWPVPSRNLHVADTVCLHDEPMAPTK